LERVYAAVVPFDRVTDDISLEELQLRWIGGGDGSLVTTRDVAPMLSPVLGNASVPAVDKSGLLATLEDSPSAVGIVPFDELDPRLKVLSVDGINVLSNQLNPDSYPLAVALDMRGNQADALVGLLARIVPGIADLTNRDATRLTTVVMTGVTAMSRGTAARMEMQGMTYPAMVISDTLSAADITHASNEVPFLDDCVVDNTVNNLVLCSHTDYWQALEAIGTDIVGLSGNHVNDFGREGARRSLAFYRENGIPVYGSGLNDEEACAPLLWEHNGNTLAFLAFLAFGPPGAWATEELPGACYYYDHKDEIAELVQELAKTVDIVSVELQYVETYEPFPTNQQVIEFRELRQLGADIVTGVQSHVPQAIEPYGDGDDGGPGVIVYGLGNLFFDQMWSWETRTELIARHTVYEGRVLSTEILTAILENYAQPRWADVEERGQILMRIFGAAPPRPVVGER
jgi:poly-gamma-glutamate synthesis protein (capsule biosynthesis protein)